VPRMPIVILNEIAVALFLDTGNLRTNQRSLPVKLCESSRIRTACSSELTPMQRLSPLEQARAMQRNVASANY